MSLKSMEKCTLRAALTLFNTDFPVISVPYANMVYDLPAADICVSVLQIEFMPEEKMALK